MKLYAVRWFVLAALITVGSSSFARANAWADSSGIHLRASLKKKPACRDRKDNDRDGLTDYPSDPGCKSRRDNSEKNRAPTSPTPVPTPGSGVEVGGSLLNYQIFPRDNPWNQDISQSAVDPNSDTLIASIGLSGHLHPDFGTFYEGRPIGIPYVVVGSDLAKSAVSFEYDDESDAGPYPIPSNPPIEGGSDSDGDRHILMFERDTQLLYELYSAYPSAGGGWSAGSGAIFDITSNALRPLGWTSADAAGLPILPGLVRYDEVVEKGEINHALRFTVQRTRRAFVHPARHFASSNTSAALPPMGMRVRLKASFDISGFSAPVQVILRALKKHGMLLADNGSNWYISGAHDARWDDDLLSDLKQVPASALEVVQMGEIVTDP